MADPKKPDDKKEKKSIYSNLGTELIFLFAGLIIASIILNQFLAYLNSSSLGNGSLWSRFVIGYGRPLWHFWKGFAIVSGAASLIWLIFSLRKLRAIDEADQKVYGLQHVESNVGRIVEHMPEAVGQKKENERWAKVKKLSLSENSSDWRLAIIEADVMLEELLRSLALHGDTVGDMLKSAEGTIINTDAAWEAHKIRNRIAHSGAGFELTDRQARHTIALFETVFKEAGMV